MKTAPGTVEIEVFSLLRQWCDALLLLQVDMPGVSELHGAVLCPACKTVHGRCHEAVFPLMYMADKTGEPKYLNAAKKLFVWGENMVCPDGAVRNDAKSEWKGVTVFAAVALHDALYYHGGLLSQDERASWEQRLRGMAAWLFNNLHTDTPAYLNYYAANACAMALLGNYFGNEDYLLLASRLASFCFGCVTENGLIYGEGRPTASRTQKGCFAVDPGGYNVEETLPMLCRYALAMRDDASLEKCRKLFYTHLEWMLPDGAWDNSMGTRGFKWTYWGSRTTDGCQEALFRLGKRDPVFAEAALRNLQLYSRCTKNGLLYGGPDYFAHGEPPCVHHTFCHAKTLAGALENGIADFERCQLPAQDLPPLKYYPEADTCRVAFGGWLADITGYDYPCAAGCHASGGALSLLWHKKTGPLIASGSVDNALREPHNQQLPSEGTEMRCTCARIEAAVGGEIYGQHYDFDSEITYNISNKKVIVCVDACLCSNEHMRMERGNCRLEYTFIDNALTVKGCVPREIAAGAAYVIPLIGTGVKLNVLQGTMDAQCEPFFNLTPGFTGREYRIIPDQDGCFTVGFMQADDGTDYGKSRR